VLSPPSYLSPAELQQLAEAETVFLSLLTLKPPIVSSQGHSALSEVVQRIMWEFGCCIDFLLLLLPWHLVAL
jgi:hypothetical protein